MGEAITALLWDLEDFPIPNGRCLCSFVENIKSALRDAGYLSDSVTIYVYSDTKNESPPAFWHEFIHAGILVRHVGDNHSRVMSMIEDIVLFGRVNRDDYGSGTGTPKHLIVVSKSIPEDPLLVRALEAMKGKGYNILLAQHDEHDDYDVALAIASDVWVWETLFDGGEPLGPYVTDTDSEE
ncbi:hypothetical protein ISN45_Aa05g029530 [Arabidopsis thaliana x Arabidopsis arenosa]|uniref:NYN domain-containing protein n=1 Tax=Arabidopsis thaliana x Arabidopsis arenosa TaxID=1240361 RepID=A0A8T1ZQ19_9BRAS|nr:hypothetical protein ISN45_Aa05g029530 [Arabidopsis thaliana x Arabidopsis arenosa]